MHYSIKKRPELPAAALREPSELKVGTIYVWYWCKDGIHRTSLIETISEPDHDKVRVKFRDPHFWGERDKYLSELGLKPFHDGTWSHYGYLIEFR